MRTNERLATAEGILLDCPKEFGLESSVLKHGTDKTVTKISTNTSSKPSLKNASNTEDEYVEVLSPEDPIVERTAVPEGFIPKEK